MHTGNTNAEDAPKEPFFPHRHTGKSGISGFEEDWSSGHLLALREKPLPVLAEDRNAEAYRLTLLPSFDCGKMIRISKNGEDYEIIVREDNAHGGCKPGWTIAEGIGFLQKAELEEFDELLRDASFFTSDSTVRDIGLDGSQWVLEAVKEGKYHVLSRWTPDYNTKARNLEAFVACCEWMIKRAPDLKPVITLKPLNK